MLWKKKKELKKDENKDFLKYEVEIEARKSEPIISLKIELLIIELVKIFQVFHKL